MELPIINQQGENAGIITLDQAIFDRSYNEALIHQVVNAFLANARLGTRAQKTRSEINKSTRKPWKQKGTGRARAGTASSPIWRGGARTFPNKPEENFSQKINKKMYRAAMAAILSQLIRDQRLIITDDLNLDNPKTKSFLNLMNNMTLNVKSLLVVVDQFSENVFLSSRNLANVLILETHQVDPYSLIRCNKILFTKNAIEKLQEQWI